MCHVCVDQGVLEHPKEEVLGRGGLDLSDGGDLLFSGCNYYFVSSEPSSTPLLRAAPPPPQPKRAWRANKLAVRSRPFCLSDYLFAPPPQAALRAGEPAPNSFPPLGPQCVQRYQFCPCASPVLASGHLAQTDALGHRQTSIFNAGTP